jgi:hypothetical protein
LGTGRLHPQRSARTPNTEKKEQKTPTTSSTTLASHPSNTFGEEGRAEGRRRKNEVMKGREKTKNERGETQTFCGTPTG